MRNRSLSDIKPPRKKKYFRVNQVAVGQYPELTPWPRRNNQAYETVGATPRLNADTSFGLKIDKSSHNNAGKPQVVKEKKTRTALFYKASHKRAYGLVLISVGLAVLVGLFSVFRWGLAAKDDLIDRSRQGAEALLNGSDALVRADFGSAQDSFKDAGLIFDDLGGELNDLSRLVKIVSGLVPGDPLDAAELLSRAGTHFANAGIGLTQTLEILSDVKDHEFLPSQVKINQLPGAARAPALSQNDKTFSKALKKAQASFDMVIGEIARAKDLIDTVDIKRLPSGVTDKITSLVGQIPAVVQDLHKIRGLLGVVAQIIGVDQAHYYAVVLQNSRELRPTGGFMGQFAILKVQDGQVEDVKIKSIYDADGQVQSKVRAPFGLNIIAKNWSLRDANWSADFPTAAQDILSFFKKTGDPVLSGVIALTPKVIEDLLTATGPIDLPDLGLNVSADNFVEQAQNEVPDKSSARDKIFFSEFSQKLLLRLFNPKNREWQKYLAILAKAANRKDLQIFFSDEQAQKLVATIGADGGMPEVDGQDVLFVSEANIGGGKTDVFIDEQRSLNIVIGPETIKHELTIVRHDSRTNEFIHQKNRQFVRFYLPPNSKLIAAAGFDRDDKDLLAYECSNCEPGSTMSAERQIDQDPESGTRIFRAKNYLVLANWVSSLPQDTKTIKIVYETPLTAVQKASRRVIMTMGRQAGTKDIVVEVRARKAPGEKLRYVSGLRLNAGGIGIGEIMLDRDRIIGILF